jgi:hypothetical protein
MTPLQIKREIERAEDMARRNGFNLSIGNDIEIRADRHPYAANVVIFIGHSFSEIMIFFTGYEQMQLEKRELNRDKK